MSYFKRLWVAEQERAFECAWCGEYAPANQTCGRSECRDLTPEEEAAADAEFERMEREHWGGE